MREFVDKETVRRTIQSPRSKEQMIHILDSMEAVEIVRCKECRFYDDCGDNIGICRIWFDDCGGYNAVKDTDYCSYGEERKT